MVRFKELTIMNFMSFGAKKTTIPLDSGKLVAILGINKDSSFAESRNGTGKSSIFDAISYCLFGNTSRGISVSKLVNKRIRPGQYMQVSVSFETDGYEYLVVRGEKPSTLKFYRKPRGDDRPFTTLENGRQIFDISRTKPETNKDIISVLGFDRKLFSLLVCNTSDDIPFPKLPAESRREIIELVFGMSKLGEKVKSLKKQRKDLKSAIAELEVEHRTIRAANNRTLEQIASLEAKHEQWMQDKDRQISEIEEAISGMETDIEVSQDDLNVLESDLKTISELRKAAHEFAMRIQEIGLKIRFANKQVKSLDEQFDRVVADLQALENSKCPTCNQPFHDADAINAMRDSLNDLTQERDKESNRLDAMRAQLEELVQQEEEINNQIAEILSVWEVDDEHELSQLKNDVKDALDMGARKQMLQEQLSTLFDSESPYLTTISEMREKGLIEIDTTELDDKKKQLANMEYLIDLLQSQDSFIRKALIGMQIPFLNKRIREYLSILELPYTAKVDDTFSLIISNPSGEYEWGNLSKGQKHRVTLAMNLALQDLWYRNNGPINLLLIDELLDAGLCTSGATAMITILRNRVETNKQSCYLITHRQELHDKVD
ncbi:MAG: hypothetical protein D6698_09485, partial [Gammaproteobacteria bacterium]